VPADLRGFNYRIFDFFESAFIRDNPREMKCANWSPSKPLDEAQ
jgi:hypothetical protein